MINYYMHGQILGAELIFRRQRDLPERYKNEFYAAALIGFKVFVKSLSLSGGSLTSVMHFSVLFA